MFSAGLPLGQRQLGVDVPSTFEQLFVGEVVSHQPRPPGYISTKQVRVGRDRLKSRVPSVLASSNPHVLFDLPIPSSISHLNSRMFEPGSSISFNLTGRRGAVLLTRYETYRQDTLRAGACQKYTKKHFDSWVAFANNAGYGDVNPLLVTGVDMTRDFAMVAYSNDDDVGVETEFTILAPGVTSNSPWGTWHTLGFVFTNCGPQPCCPPSFMQSVDLAVSGDDNTELDSNLYNQCVFIRYFTARKRLGFPKVIKAGAGPHNLVTGSREDRELLKAVTRSPSDSGSDGAPSLHVNGESKSHSVIHNVAPVRACLYLPVHFF